MSFTWNGVSSDTKKFNVTERHIYNAPAFDVNAIEVPGRSGDILNSQNRYKNKTVTYTGFLRAKDFAGATVREKLSTGLVELKSWLCADAGTYHDLADDYDPGYTRKGFISGETAIEEVTRDGFGVTITVTFNCKPFMYKNTTPVTVTPKSVGPSPIATFTDGADNAPLSSLKFYIEPKQSGSGDPSPQNIRPISGTAEVDGVAAGKNLLDSVLPNVLTIVNTNYVKVGAASGTTAVFQAKAGETYRVSGATGKNRSLIAYFDAKPIVDSTSSSPYELVTLDYSDGYVFTATRSAWCACYLANTTLTGVNIQVELGSTATPYAAPTITPITISLGQTVYGGYVDAVEGKLVVDTLRIKASDYNGWAGITSYQSNFNATNGVVSVRLGYSNLPSPVRTTGWYGEALASALKTYNGSIWNKVNAVGCFGATDGIVVTATYQMVGMSAWSSDANTVATAFKTCSWWNDLEFVLPLATPIEYTVTPQQVSSLLGVNNIWCDSGDTTVGYVSETLQNPTGFPALPFITLEMTDAGVLNVGGKAWSIGSYNGTLYCDSENMDWYDSTQLQNSLVTGDGFPVLEAGDTSVFYSGGISSITIDPRWRAL